MTAVYTVQWDVAQLGKGVSFKALNPVGGVLCVIPSRFVLRMELISCLFEGLHCRCVLLYQGISTISDGSPVSVSLFPSIGQCYGGVSSQANVSSAAIDSDSQDPGFSLGLTDKQVETAAIGVATRFLESLNPSC